MTPERLTGLDASFLYMETPTLHMHVAMAAVFDPSTVPGGYSFRRIRQLINDRIPLAPVFQRRLVEVPMRLGHPVWVDDPEFDIDNHLRRAALPSPGGMRELGDFAADVISRQLHRDRPSVGDVDRRGFGGRQDRAGDQDAPQHDRRSLGGRVARRSLRPGTQPARDPAQTARQLDSRIPSGFELVSQAMMAGLVAPFDLGRMILRTTRNIFDVRRIRQSHTAKAALPLTAPRTSINVAVHARRRVAFAAASLADAKALKNKMGTTVNDVVLAMCAGALRRLPAGRRRASGHPARLGRARLRHARRGRAQGLQQGVGHVRPAARATSRTRWSAWQLIHEGTKGAKEEHQALGAATLQNWAEHAAPNVFAAAARLYTGMKLADRHRPVANLVISNVPGPDFPLYLGGSQMLGMFPLGPVMDGMGLNITIMSNMGVLYWGLASDARAVPRLWDVAAAIPHALTELMEAAGLESQPFDVPIHLGPGMPPTANWIRAAASVEAEATGSVSA